MPELHPDTSPSPNEIPNGAVLVLRWCPLAHPATWEVVGIVDESPTLDEALEVAVTAMGGTHDLLATKIGGQASKAQRMTATPKSGVDVTAEPVPEPDE